MWCCDYCEKGCLSSVVASCDAASRLNDCRHVRGMCHVLMRARVLRLSVPAMAATANPCYEGRQVIWSCIAAAQSTRCLFFLGISFLVNAAAQLTYVALWKQLKVCLK